MVLKRCNTDKAQRMLVLSKLDKDDTKNMFDNMSKELKLVSIITSFQPMRSSFHERCKSAQFGCLNCYWIKSNGEKLGYADMNPEVIIIYF